MRLAIMTTETWGLTVCGAGWTLSRRAGIEAHHYHQLWAARPRFPGQRAPLPPRVRHTPRVSAVTAQGAGTTGSHGP
jgi:hypothetical protein